MMQSRLGKEVAGHASDSTELPHGRGTKQARARQKRQLIGAAAAEVIALHGITGMTHRLVAQRAGVPLAATTYHFERKSDIINAASDMTFGSYELSFDKTLQRMRNGRGSPLEFRDFFRTFARNGAGDARVQAICWAEITLGASRSAASRSVMQNWFNRTIGVFADIIEECGLTDAHQRAVFTIDLLIGLTFMTIGLGLTPEMVEALLEKRSDLIDLKPNSSLVEGGVRPRRRSAKAVETREKILSATLDILRADGPGAVNCRTVAAAAQVTQAAPFYYYPSITNLLAAAQQRLSSRLKDRYRDGLARAGGTDPNIDRLIDRTAAVFLREATEYAGESVANFSVWLRADSRPAVRDMLWQVTADQHRAWRHVLERWKGSVEPIDPLFSQALFLGKLVRTLATGSRTEDIAGVRQQFAYGLGLIIRGPAMPGESGT